MGLPCVCVKCGESCDYDHQRTADGRALDRLYDTQQKEIERLQNIQDEFGQTIVELVELLRRIDKESRDFGGGRVIGPGLLRDIQKEL